MRLVQNLGQINYAGPLRSWFYSLAETSDIGRDTGTQVSKLYKDPFPIVGALDKLVIRLTD